MIGRLAAILLCGVLSVSAAAAQTEAGAQATAALAQLDAAALDLGKAKKARDRVRALTATIHAFEAGLSAMREGLRQAAIRERVLNERLAAREADVAQLFASLQAMSLHGTTEVLLHPSGAMDTARAGMLLAELGPVLHGRALALKADLDEVQMLRGLQQAAADRMATGLSQLQEARAALNQAMADRTDLPARFTADPTRTAVLIASAETLEGFASGLSQIVEEETAPPLEATFDLGSLPLPVRGVLLRAAGEADAAGVVRPGILIATRPEALVTTPTAATIRYAGPLLDFGEVVMLEPRANLLVVLAGLAQTYGTAGQVIAEGTPVGIMAARRNGNSQSLSPSGDGAGTQRTETLYIEVRENNRPVDPGMWFAIGQDR